MTLNWTQPNPQRNHYWQSDRYDFWVTRKEIWNVNTDVTKTRWILCNGTEELGVYDSLAEARNAAEPAHGVNESPMDEPVCYWCQGSHPGQICKDAPYYVEGAKMKWRHQRKPRAQKRFWTYEGQGKCWENWNMPTRAILKSILRKTLNGHVEARCT